MAHPYPEIPKVPPPPRGLLVYKEVCKEIPSFILKVNCVSVDNVNEFLAKFLAQTG